MGTPLHNGSTAWQEAATQRRYASAFTLTRMMANRKLMRICLSSIYPDAARQACPAFQHPVAA